MIITLNNKSDKPICFEVENDADINVNPNSDITLNIPSGAKLEIISDNHIKYSNSTRPTILNS